MITIYEVKTGDAVLTFHPRTFGEGAAMRALATAMCERINQDLKCGAVSLSYSGFARCLPRV